MIIIQLTGGLGNQMFQYAMGRAASERLGVKLKIDSSVYKKSRKRYFGLDSFSIKAEEAAFFDILKLKYFPQRNVVRESRFPFCSDLRIKNSTYIENLNQSWQSEKYFIDCADKIRQDFRLKTFSQSFLKMADIIGSPDSVSVHVRRGDYIAKQDTYFLLPEEYYKSAMQELTKQFSGLKYFFFSDDIQWVEENFNMPSGSVMVSGKNFSDAEEMVLQSMTRHHIIANSSFSWWSAWLGEKDGMILAPKDWFSDERIDTKDLIPERWIKI